MKIPVDPAVCAELYPPAIDVARRVAREHGYALGVHGSQKRDLDLIACPWVEECSSPEVLVRAIEAALPGWWLHNVPVLKPQGRVAYTIYTHDHAHIDISIMPCKSL